MSLRDALRKAAGLLVELPPEEQPAAAAPDLESAPPAAGGGGLDELFADLESQGAKRAEETKSRTVEQVVRAAEGPNLEDIKVTASATGLEIGPDGKPDFTSLYRQADLPSTPFSAEQMLDMLNSLPRELPLDTKRQTVNVTLSSVGKSIGATPETIVADASRKLAALAAYADSLARETAGFVSASELEIAALQAQIEEKRKAIQASQQKLQDAVRVCSTESDRLDDVLEFFSLDLPPSKYAAGAPKQA
jgi:hypothetical protein